jgi:hypothetical protein
MPFAHIVPGEYSRYSREKVYRRKRSINFDNLVTQLDLGHPGEHGLGRAVGGFRKFHRPFHGSRVNMVAGDEIFDFYLGKDAWMGLRSLGMDAHLEGDHILPQM